MLKFIVELSPEKVLFIFVACNEESDSQEGVKKKSLRSAEE
jgi:hypothetical protein